MTRVKICGITNREDAMAACRLGAHALGFVLAESSRRISPDRAREIIAVLPPLVATVGVFLDADPLEVAELRRFCGLDWVQLHGNESEAEALSLGPRVIKALKVGPGREPHPEAYAGCALLLDTYDPALPGGTGKAFDWSLAQGMAAQRPVILAGGLNPQNVASAIAQVKPSAVDVSSGVEIEKGIKDHELIASFLAQAAA